MPKRFEGLVGLRGIGATMIIAYHMYVLNGYVGTNTFLDRTVGIGGVFVTLFFILSSFSLMCGYAEKIRQNDFEWGQFYKNRFIKLAPTFYTALILHLLLNVCAHVKEPMANIIGTASLLYALMPSNQESIVMAGWALGIEIIFYLIFPAFFELTKTRLHAILTLLGSLLLFFSYNSYYGVGILNNHINIIRQLLPFAIGAALYYCIPFMTHVKKSIRMYIAFILRFILLILFVGWDKFFQNQLMIYVAFSITILNQIQYNDVLTMNCLMQALGKISYEMYLFHMIIYRILYYLNVIDLLNSVIHSKVISYMAFLFIELLFTILFSYFYKSIFLIIRKKLAKRPKMHKG